LRRLVSAALTLCGLLACAGLPGCASSGAGAAQADDPPSRIGGFVREAIGYLSRRDRVGVGDPAPDFELMPLRFYDFDLDGAESAPLDPYRGVRLSSFAGKRPVALVFGSYT